MFGNAGGEIAARSLVGFEPDKLTAYVIEILKKCKEYAERVNKPQWAGIMDGEIVIDSYNHRNLPSNSPLYDFLIRNSVTNVILCGYQLSYPLGDHRRSIIPRGIYTQDDAPGTYPYDYFRQYVRGTRMLSGAGCCYGVVHGSLGILKMTGYSGAVVDLGNMGLKDMAWPEVIERVNEEVAAVQTQ